MQATSRGDKGSSVITGIDNHGPQHGQVHLLLARSIIGNRGVLGPGVLSLQFHVSFAPVLHSASLLTPCRCTGI